MINNRLWPHISSHSHPYIYIFTPKWPPNSSFFACGSHLKWYHAVENERLHRIKKVSDLTQVSKLTQADNSFNASWVQWGKVSISWTNPTFCSMTCIEFDSHSLYEIILYSIQPEIDPTHAIKWIATRITRISC
jgi:hypothetical protein